MRKVYKLRSWVKTVLCLVIIESIIISYLFIYSNRIEKIEHDNTEKVNIQFIEK